MRAIVCGSNGAIGKLFSLFLGENHEGDGSFVG